MAGPRHWGGVGAWEGRERWELGALSGVQLTPIPGGAALTQPQLLSHGLFGGLLLPPGWGFLSWDLSVPSGAIK